MNDDDGRRRILHLWIDNEAADGAGAIFDFNPLAVARRLFQFGLGPVLGESGMAGNQQGKTQSQFCFHSSNKSPENRTCQLADHW